MSERVPAPALALGVAGLIPFFWGVATLLSDPLAAMTVSTLGPRFVGPYVQLSYGAVILSFMGGTLWGFATRERGRLAASAYVFSVLPALWAFLFVGGGPVSAAIHLIAGFIGLLGLDWIFWRAGLAPRWWMRLRLGLTACVVAALGFVVA